MKAWTVRLDTLTDYQGQFPQTRERGDRAMAVIGHPQRLTTLLTTLFQRGQRLLMRRFQARGSSSHAPSPVVLVSLLLLSGYTCCQVFFAIQPKKREKSWEWTYGLYEVRKCVLYLIIPPFLSRNVRVNQKSRQELAENKIELSHTRISVLLLHVHLCRCLIG